MGQLLDAVNRVKGITENIIDKVGATNLDDVCDKIDGAVEYYEGEISSLGETIVELNAEISNFDNEIERINSEHMLDISELSQQHQMEIDSISMSYQQEIDEINSRYDGIDIDGLQNENENLRDAVNNLNNTIDSLKEFPYKLCILDSKKCAVSDDIDNDFSDIFQITPYIPSTIGLYMLMYVQSPEIRSVIDNAVKYLFAPDTPQPEFLCHCGMIPIKNSYLNLCFDNVAAAYESDNYDTQHQTISFDGVTKDFIKLLNLSVSKDEAESFGEYKQFVTAYQYIDDDNKLTQEGRIRMGLRNLKSLREFGEKIPVPDGATEEDVNNELQNLGWPSDTYDILLNIDEFVQMTGEFFGASDEEIEQVKLVFESTFENTLGETPEYVVMTLRYMLGEVNNDEEKNMGDGYMYMCNYGYVYASSLISDFFGGEQTSSIMIAFVTQNHTIFSNMGSMVQWLMHVMQGGDGQWMMPGEGGNDDDYNEPYIEYCPHCGMEMIDGDCHNTGCPNSPYYTPPTCPSCGSVLSDDTVCHNPDCPNSPEYREYCPSCGQEMIDGVCSNPDCTENPDYVYNEPDGE